MDKKSTKFGYLISLALKNIMNHKRHMFLIIIGFTLSVSVLLSVNIWAKTAEKLAINDFLDKQDFQAYIFSARKPEEMILVQDDLDNNPLVELYSGAYTTKALFNIEGKNSSYQCLPEESQQNMSNPVSITNAFVAPQIILNRISSMFIVEGNFTVENNGILLSYHQAQELSEIYGNDIGVGAILNISIAKKIPNPAYGQTRLENFVITTYHQYVVRGIYTIQESTSILQSLVNVAWFSDSVIFPFGSLNTTDINYMTTNDVPYFLFVKFNKAEISMDGLDHIIEKMQLFSEQIKKDYPSMYVYTFSGPIQTLIDAYSRAIYNIVFLFPAFLIGIIMVLFTINVVIQSRAGEVPLLRDRGADTFQIILLFIIEFVIIALIGVLFGAALSFPIAALIPSFSSSGFSIDTYRLFLSNISIPYRFIIIVTLSITILLLGFTVAKIWWEISFKQKNLEYELSIRKKIEKNFLIGLSIVVLIVNITALVFALVNSIQSLKATKNFSIIDIGNAGYTFLLFCILLIFTSQFTSYIITDKIQVKIKNILKRFAFKEAFFLHNNFVRKNKKLNTITFVLIIIISIIVFSIISISSISLNQRIEADYKNGASVRVVTYPISYDFKTNISQIEGIDEVLPILKTSGSIAYDDFTIIGLDPMLYLRIGFWDDSSFPKGQSIDNLKALNETENGIIISEPLALRLNVTIGDRLPITGLPGNLYSRSFIITGLIISAPGLGLADGRNIEMLQSNEGYVIINERYMIDTLGITNCQLFLANILPKEDIERITQEIETLPPIIKVNPRLINEEFIGSFIETYIPNNTIFFWIEFVITLLIVIILLIMFTEFILNQRLREYAIKISLGCSRRLFSRLLLIEITIVILCASIGGFLVGIGFTFSTFYLITPLLTSHNIIPFSLNVPLLELVIFLIMLIIVAHLAVLPLIIKLRNKETIAALRG